MTFRLLAYEDCGDCITGVIETETSYRSFTAHKYGWFVFDHTYPRKAYKDLEHFQGVMGKFEPYIFFLEDPLEIDRLTFTTIKKLIIEKNMKGN